MRDRRGSGVHDVSRDETYAVGMALRNAGMS